jgi:hypothetical protein
MSKASKAPKKAARPAKRKRATSRPFPYEDVAKMWTQEKTIPEIAKTIGRVGKGDDPYHSLRVALTRMGTSARDHIVDFPHGPSAHYTVAVTPITRQPEAHQVESLAEGEPNGKLVWSSRTFEEGTEESAAGSSTFYYCTRGFGKRRLERATNIVCVGSQENQLGAEKAMGKGSKGIAGKSGGSDNNWLGNRKAHHVGISPQKDRGGTKSTVGKGECGEEDGVKNGARIRPATSVAGCSL